MTEEQIARLRVDVGEDGDTGEKSFLVRPEDLERLLEERRRLLEAVRDLAVVTDSRGACTAPQCLRSYLALVEPYNAAKAAIVFAEEAAP